MKPRTIADALIAKHGPRTAHQKVKARTPATATPRRDWWGYLVLVGPWIALGIFDLLGV